MTDNQLPISNSQLQPLLSVIIPAYNEEKLIASAIGSVFRSNSPLLDQGRVEIIVADNASTDSTATLAREAGARVVHEATRQIARARNAGARAARGDYLIFLDADSEMHPAQLQRVVELLDTGKVIGGGAVVSMEASWDYQVFVKTWNTISRLARWAAGSFLFCTRAAFEETGGFDEQLFASEELALSKQLKALARRDGRKFVILTDLPVRTSNRKVVDHTRWEVYRGLFRLALRGRGGLRDRAACYFWYPETRR
jgi:glycosyltransferase involved in cell wall biosynthesis